jgi:hypothetical protein
MEFKAGDHKTGCEQDERNLCAPIVVNLKDLLKNLAGNQNVRRAKKIMP